ncbi:hypothetical protein J4E85_010255 [Alternaria conjuncta]|uniref:uncharacterized protein n=1 Tax=Alternaria conjuncta TaxID=181017 RepID=UPI0022204994|nr:uncharacterized protein J4E85_010255 [Alternaria conjuncta]KAI4916167.1 hypothetical protein J4E85_010255 [Alternaria conjuncta]
MSGCTEHTIFWLTISTGDNRGIMFGGIYGNSESERTLMKKKIWKTCETSTGHDITSEGRLDEELAVWHEKADQWFGFTYADEKDYLFLISKEKDDNEEVAKVLQSAKPEDFWAYRKFAMEPEDLIRVVEEGVATPEIAKMKDRIVVADPPTLANKELSQVIWHGGHSSLPPSGDFKSFAKKDKAIKHATLELDKPRDSLWTPTSLTTDEERAPWVGVVRVKCPVKGEKESRFGDDPRYLSV